MADVNTDVSQETQAQQTNILPADIKQMMEQSLNITPSVSEGGEANQQQQANGGEQGQEGGQQQQAAAQPEFFKDYGFDSKEAFDNKFKGYQEQEANPQVVQPKFENEQSEKAYKAALAGKLDELREALNEQHRLNSLTGIEVTDENAESILRLGMQIKYKGQGLTEREIDYKIAKQFQLPKAPTQNLEETDEDFASRKSEWESQVADIKMAKVIEAKLMKPELDAAKAQIKFPEIESPANNAADEQKFIEEQKRLDEETKQAYGTFKPDMLKEKIPFVDEANKISLDYEFQPDEESFKQVIEAVSNGDKFWELFKGQDGKPDRTKFAKTIYYGLNFGKAVTEAMKQTKNATIKAGLPDNNQGGLNRQLPNLQEPSELDKQMRQSLAGYM